MKGIVSIERIAAARQRLAELSEFSNGTPGREMQVRQAVDMLSSVLDELEAVAKDSKPEQEAAHRTKAASTFWQKRRQTGSFRSTTKARSGRNPAAGQMFGYEPAEMLDKSLTVLMPERFRQIHQTSLRRYVATGKGTSLGEPLNWPAYTRAVENSQSRSRLARTFEKTSISSPASCAISRTASDRRRPFE